jgi:glycosyltransferase involved in cell wall biosynthesis
MVTEVRELSKYFDLVQSPMDADVIYTLDPLQPDMQVVTTYISSGASKPIVWRVIAGYPTGAGAPIDDARVRNHIVLALVNSLFTKSEFLKTYPYQPPPIELVYHPLNYEAMQVPKCQQVGRYYIYVGAIERRKRSDWIAEATFRSRTITRMYFPYAESCVYEEVYRIAQLYRNGLIVTLNAPPHEVYSYMSCALALLSASSAETFFIPGIETAYYARPLISTKLPVLDELWGDTYITYNTVDELAQLMAKYFNNPTELNAYGAKMNDRLMRELWNKGVGNFGELASKYIYEAIQR